MAESREDPIVCSARRETLCFAVVWSTALAYSVWYCYTYGSRRPLDASLDGMTFVFGWPDWVFWGILAPWLACTAWSVVFALWIMGDTPLGREVDDDETTDAEPQV